MQALVKEINSTLLNLVGRCIEIIPGVLISIAILVATRFLADVIRRSVARLGRRTLKNVSLRTLLTQISFVTTWVVGIIVAAVIAFPGLDLSSIVALLGLGSVAVGFAFQDIFKNFLAGVLLLLQEPFNLGDQIIVSDYEGTVESIELRSTQIRTYQGEVVVVPNSVVFTNPVQVLTARAQRRTDLAIGVDYNTSLAEAIEILLRATDSVEGVLSEPEVEVDVVAFGDSSIDFLVRYWTAPQMKNVRKIKTQVMLAVKQSCDQAGISIPYPIRSLYWYDQAAFNETTSREPSIERNGHKMINRDFAGEA